MATDRHRRFSLLDGFGALSFVVIVATFLFVSDRAGVRMFGIHFFVGAVIHFRSGEPVEYGWEGRPPSGHITGWGAVLFYLVTGAIGLLAAIWPDTVIKVLGWDQ